MKTYLRYSLFAVSLLLIVANFFIFASSISIGQKITYYEVESYKLHLENIELEKKVYEVNSLSHVASEAANLRFVQSARPMYLDSLNVAKLP